MFFQVVVQSITIVTYCCSWGPSSFVVYYCRADIIYIYIGIDIYIYIDIIYIDIYIYRYVYTFAFVERFI